MSPDDASEVPMDNSVNDATRSTAVISEPKSIQSFCNFLLVSKDFCSTTGAQAGLPPTIVASQIFENGSLKSLNVSFYHSMFDNCKTISDFFNDC